MSRNSIASTRHMSNLSVMYSMSLIRFYLTFEDIKDKDEEVYRMLYPDKHAVEHVQKSGLWIRPQGTKKVGVTLKLLHQEYVIAFVKNKCGYSYGILAKFCYGYSDFTIGNKLTNHLLHKPGIATEVDWSGPTMSYVDTSTGKVSLYISLYQHLPYSQYSYTRTLFWIWNRIPGSGATSTCMNSLMG